MQIRIAHRTTYAYEAPVRAMTQVLRLTPRPNDGQHVRRWRIDTEPDLRLRQTEDAFGNIVHLLFTDQPVSKLVLGVTGEVETSEAHGVLRGAVERQPPQVYLRETPLTACDDALAAFADAVAQDGSDEPLDFLHRLLGAVHQRIAFDTCATHPATSAAQAFALGSGVCQDLSHIFIAVARRHGVPARYVSGHLARADGVIEQEASHAWAEAYVPDLGWLGFDPTNGICPTEQHVRVATALDYLGAAPVRGSRQGGGTEALSVRLSVERDAPRQAQN